MGWRKSLYCISDSWHTNTLHDGHRSPGSPLTSWHPVLEKTIVRQTSISQMAKQLPNQLYRLVWSAFQNQPCARILSYQGKYSCIRCSFVALRKPWSHEDEYKQNPRVLSGDTQSCQTPDSPNRCREHAIKRKSYRLTPPQSPW